jgi:hypothetical protein
MEFRNHTPHPALAFVGVDPFDQSFHVVVLRQTYTWNDAGELAFAQEQLPLCEEDEFFNSDLDPDSDDPRQESDLCQFKPRCDVIVNATAHAPGGDDGKPSRATRFDVRLLVRRPDTAAPLPAEPQGLNQFMAPNGEDVRRWEQAVALAKTRLQPGQRLIDKTLRVTGERFFVKRNVPLRFAIGLINLCTLGLVSLPTWRLTSPRPTLSVPLGLSNAWGGNNRIELGSKAAERVPKKHRLDKELAAELAKADIKAPAAQSAWQANPAGKGYAADWYLRAAKVKRVAAPQVEHVHGPIKLRHFNLARRDKLGATHKEASALSAGFGLRPKGHPERAKLAGTIDERFINSTDLLPEDFDFGVWNAAWPDQQVDALQGDEHIELTNLCAPTATGARRDQRGNTRLELKLPGHLPFILVRFEDGPIGELAARLDTLLIEPEQRRLTCVWRATLAMQPRVRVLEARMLMQRDVAAMRSNRGMAPPPADDVHASAQTSASSAIAEDHHA